jgi:glutathione S-transferase
MRSLSTAEIAPASAGLLLIERRRTGERYSAADITALVTVDFAKALELSVPTDHAALKRWYETVSSRPGAAA